MHVYLIGYRGSGKSTVGRLLSQVLGIPWLDTDAMIEANAGKSIREIFESEGEDGFRVREEAVLAEVADRDTPHVVATGGGAILRTSNRQNMIRTGYRVWLDASAEFLYQRICQDETSSQRRPNLTDRGGFKEVADILAARQPLYADLSQKTVATDSKTPDEVVAEILDWVKSQA